MQSGSSPQTVYRNPAAVCTASGVLTGKDCLAPSSLPSRVQGRTKEARPPPPPRRMHAPIGAARKRNRKSQRRNWHLTDDFF
ncbi:hypothetical protein Zmor_025403 [Zophobas morio]|uniref:Uncharacterized protein n=1 Tax=Zophobas morio TaxID=2755281 RepID=A0AA38HRF8_9CUCU|nr:hypothetical protein Zmor_025403 [Zophobas morio]